MSMQIVSLYNVVSSNIVIHIDRIRKYFLINIVTSIIFYIKSLLVITNKFFSHFKQIFHILNRFFTNLNRFFTLFTTNTFFLHFKYRDFCTKLNIFNHTLFFFLLFTHYIFIYIPTNIHFYLHLFKITYLIYDRRHNRIFYNCMFY